MEIAIIALVVLVILGYAFRVDQWEIWIKTKWRVIYSQDVTGQIGNAFHTNNSSGILTIKVSTNKTKKKLKATFNNGQIWEVNIDMVYAQLPELRNTLIENGYEL